MSCKCCINCPKQNCTPKITDIEAFTKHLELIQSAISRLSGHSFAMKQWCLTIVTIIVSVLALTKENYVDVHLKSVLLIGVIALTFCFWFLDSFYLWSERNLRKKYEESAKTFNEKNKTNLFSMKTNLEEVKNSYYTIGGNMRSKTVCPLYLILTILEIILAVLECLNLIGTIN